MPCNIKLELWDTEVARLKPGKSGALKKKKKNTKKHIKEFLQL